MPVKRNRKTFSKTFGKNNAFYYQEVRRIRKETLKEAREELLADLIAIAPEDTGRLKSEIEIKDTGGSIIATSEAIDPISNIDYAPLQEFGTRFIPARPFFYPTTANAWREARANYKAKLSNLKRFFK